MMALVTRAVRLCQQRGRVMVVRTLQLLTTPMTVTKVRLLTSFADL
jgi:hypothetical protein